MSTKVATKRVISTLYGLQPINDGERELGVRQGEREEPGGGEEKEEEEEVWQKSFYVVRFNIVSAEHSEEPSCRFHRLFADASQPEDVYHQGADAHVGALAHYSGVDSVLSKKPHSVTQRNLLSTLVSVQASTL